MAVLNATTVVRNGYDVVVLYAGDEVPEWAADQIGDHLIKTDEQADEVASRPTRRRKPADEA